MGIDILGIDILGIDIVALPPLSLVWKTNIYLVDFSIKIICPESNNRKQLLVVISPK